jgi:hypothetical protein
MNGINWMNPLKLEILREKQAIVQQAFYERMKEYKPNEY